MGCHHALEGRQRIPSPEHRLFLSDARRSKNMSVQEKEELAKMLAELILTDPVVRGAVWRCVCNCPNVMVEY